MNCSFWGQALHHGAGKIKIKSASESKYVSTKKDYITIF